MSYDATDPDFQYLAIDKKALLKKEGWMKGEIQSTKGDDVVVLADKGGVSTTSCLTYLLPVVATHLLL